MAKCKEKCNWCESLPTKGFQWTLLSALLNEISRSINSFILCIITYFCWQWNLRFKNPNVKVLNCPKLNNNQNVRYSIRYGSVRIVHHTIFGISKTPLSYFLYEEFFSLVLTVTNRWHTIRTLPMEDSDFRCSAPSKLWTEISHSASKFMINWSSYYVVHIWIYKCVNYFKS